MDDWKSIRNWSREEMMKRVARFRSLKGSDGGLPDSKLPECRRKLYAVIGFQPPQTQDASVSSPVGADASAMPAISIAEGFNLGYCKAKPGKGPLMHNHDTNETFIPMTGKWRCEWNEGDAIQWIDLDPYDVISFPTGVARRFMNVTYDEPGKEHLLMFIIGGNQPQAEFTPDAMQRCEAFAKAPAQQTASRAQASRRQPSAIATKGGPARGAPQRKPARRAER
ncbi:MAG TPA: cupin domain-containing protein [Burkholderiales bacterium]|nr:cupin domain-containing protein [Burkholderiales bacterium]